MPVYKQAKQQLVNDIGTQWQDGDRLPTVRHLAERYQVGYVSMHRAVRELADEGLLTARPRAGIQVAEASARNRRAATAASSIAGAVVDIVTIENSRIEGMHQRMLEGIFSGFENIDCTVNHRDTLTGDREQSYENSDADALIFLNVGRSRIVTSPRHHVVSIEAGMQSLFPPDKLVDLVTVNQFHGASLAGQAFRQAGFTSACFLGAHGRLPTEPGVRDYDDISWPRLRGFEAGFGMPIAEGHRLLTDFYDESAGAVLANEYVALDDRPRAVFAATDELAVGFVHGLLAHGLRPLQDYFIIGFDGQQRGRDMRWGPLSSIEIPARDMGCKAAELLVDRFDQPDRPSQTVALGCQLFEGNTYLGEGYGKEENT